ncbi:MAG: aminoacetone oxidase family FAD-binding enzyme [Planctomycetota bacterium]
MERDFQIAVIGAGAAGLMSALWAARGGAKVVLLEGSNEAGRKILISGGGRCNLLPSVSEDNDFFTSGSRNVLKRLFRTWRLQQLQDFFTWELDLPLEEEEGTGKLFPEVQKAKVVRDKMLAAAEEAGVSFLCPFRVESVHKAEDRFCISSNEHGDILADRVILATGGQSVPQTGSDGHGYLIAKSLGHKILPTYPALVPLTGPDEDFASLSGLSLKVQWRAVLNGKVLEERERELLFTHKGFSGPAILDASHYAVRDKAEIRVAWEGFTKEEWVPYIKSRARQSLMKAISEQIPKRLAEVLLERCGLRGDMRCGNLDRNKTDILLTHLCDFPLPVKGSRGFQVAEVTGGGIPLDEVNPSTLESRKTPGLFLCGELLDVFGRIGGFNFQWAFTTGRLAGESASRLED